ncbi:MAG TPA: winged helix-turn-helix domain-containing protein, partial [Terriglobia bacterium]|nr:winged helix-turn-helix domain-containing protein [Terriglobia bacterium]
MSMIRDRLYRFGALTMNTGSMTLRKGEKLISVPPKVFDTLLALVEQRGEVVSKDQLMRAVWPDCVVEESNLTQNIFVLRRILSQATGDEEYIQTIPKRGYRITVPVDVESGRDAPVKAVSAAPIPNHAGRFSPSAKGIAAASTLAIELAVLLWHSPPAVRAIPNFTQLTRDGIDKEGWTKGIVGPHAALATDGSRIFFTAGTMGSSHISQMSISGGPASNIPLPFSAGQVLDFSTVRSELLVAEYVSPSAETPLWAVNLLTGNAHRVGNFSVRDACWSRDGNHIAFVRGAELYVTDEYGADQRKLADLPGLGWRPRWSPDNKSLRLTIVEPKSVVSSIWEVALDSGRIHPLLPGWDNPPQECCGEWSADGRQYFFQATRNGKSEIWAIPVNTGPLDRLLRIGRKPVQITTGQMNSMVPAPSPNGKLLFVIGRQERGELERFDANSHQFVPYLAGIPADFIDFSRDGQWMTYSLLPEGTLWRSRIDGTELLQLTFQPDEARVPQWSPDGRSIIFHTTGGGRRQQIRVISRDGGPAEVVPGTNGSEMHPMWSPDGSKIIYSDYPFLGARPDQVAVHILDLKSRQVKTVPGSNQFFGPTWSPDGRYATALAPGGE